MLPHMCLESAGHGIDAEFARALPMAGDFDLSRPLESLFECMRHADHGFLLELSKSNPLGWRYCAELGVGRLKGAAVSAHRLGEQPDPQFTRDVLIPSYMDAIAADQPVVHRIAAVANNTFLAYRKLTIPLCAQERIGGVSHILTLTKVDFAMPQIHRRKQAVHSLSQRERQCLSAVANGLVGKQIAAELGVSEKMIELHLARARRNWERGRQRRR